jgi:hypothetical protein
MNEANSSQKGGNLAKVTVNQTKFTDPTITSPEKENYDYRRPISERPWYITVSIVIATLAIFGGYQGVYDLFKKEKPILHYAITDFYAKDNSQSIWNNTGKRTKFLFYGTLFNDGGKPFFPLEFTGKIKYNDQEWPLVPTLEIESVSLTDSVKFRMRTVKDLREVTIVDDRHPATGNLLLETSMSREDLVKGLKESAITVTLNCKDRSGNEYTATTAFLSMTSSAIPIPSKIPYIIGEERLAYDTTLRRKYD